MNSSDQVIWSLAHQSWMAMPETAAGKGKASANLPGVQAHDPCLTPRRRRFAAPLSPLAAALLAIFAGSALHEARADVFDTPAGTTLTINGTVTTAAELTKNGAGTLVLTGTGSTIDGHIEVTEGALRVEGGGQINFGTVFYGLLLPGNNTGVTVTVTGAGSRMTTVSSYSILGALGGSSTLSIENGGEFSGNHFYIGSGAGATGTINVTGANSRLVITDSFQLGWGGDGFVNVVNGGRIQSRGMSVGTSGTGTILISGAGSRWDASSSLSMQRGSLFILDGGVFNASSVNLLPPATATSTILVSGAGSQLVSANSIFLGLSGDAALTIANSGRVIINGGFGALNPTNGGTLSIGGARGQAATAAGTLNAATVQFSGVGIVNFNHTDSSYTFNPVIAGIGSVVLEGPGTTLFGSVNTYTGSTTVNGGTLRTGGLNRLAAASAHIVGTGGTLDLAGFSHTLVSLSNSGVVSLAGAAPGTGLTVTGAYVGNGGALRLMLGAGGSLSDRLILNGAGASASGNTYVQVVNLGSLGAPTSGNGIEVVSAQAGATTTATAFALANGHVDAGIYEYKLYRGTADQNWYLRSEHGAIPTYRAEVPLLSALPTQVRLADTAMLGNRGLRGGDVPTGATEKASAGRNAWGRLISTDIDVTQPGFASPQSAGRLNGFQSGTDLFASANLRAGVYVGALDGTMQVSGYARGVQGAVGGNKLRARYLGGYATWSEGTGFYVDTVLQAGYQDYTLQPQGNASVSQKSNSLLASVEIGQAFDVGHGWSIEPQLQLINQRVKMNDLALSGAGVQQDTPDSLTARVGVRVKTNMNTDMGVLKPYGRLNLYHASRGLDTARFGTAAATADVTTRTGGRWTEAAVGTTLAIDKNWSVYGEISRLFSNGGDVKVRSDVSASLGVVARW